MKEELYWGKLTWGLFHTMSEKINDTTQLNNIINMIVLICNYLPCPYCRSHAKTYITRKPINKLVRTKEELKKYLFDFHNVVNMKTKKPIYQPQILEQYAKINLYTLLKNWVIYFRIFNITPYTIKEHTEREKIKNQVNNYLLSIKDKFTI